MSRKQLGLFGVVLFIVFIGDLLWAYLSGNWNTPFSIQTIILMVIVLLIPLSLYFYTGKE